MERDLYAIEYTVGPRARGWRIVGLEEAPRPPLPNGAEALAEASALARRRHAQTGRPTGVKVRMSCGDTVLMSPLG